MCRVVSAQSTERNDHGNRVRRPGPCANPARWRSFIYEVAQALAPGWERHRARIETSVTPVREWLLRELAPSRETLCWSLQRGPATPGSKPPRSSASEALCISTDFSPEMVAVARRRGAELGLSTVDYRVMDAERIELDAASVDGVVCRFGYMLMASPSTALSETRRVLRPGGRLVLAVWGAPEHNPWVTVLAKILVEHGHVPPPEPEAPSPFALADDKTIRALLEGAGFANVRTEQVQLSFTFRDLDDYVGYSADTAGPAALVLGKLSDDESRAV